ncbi:MAG: hypothetical protein P1V36_15705 [Planctomycetota bacterium]|nr:hypothetical protein [Planctomycetota bacterium]
MRRILMPLFVLTLALGLAACGDAPAATGSNSTGGTAPAATDASTGADGVLTDVTNALSGGGSASEDGSSCCDKKAEGSCCDEKACADCEPGKCSCKEGAAAAVACVCKAGKAGKPVWCEGCDKGYVDGKEVCCPSCVKKAVKKAAGTEQ